MFVRNHMLQQETINEFVRDLNPRERYDSMLHLLNDDTPRLLLKRIESLASECQDIADLADSERGKTKDRRERLEADVSELEEMKGNLSIDLLRAQFDELLEESGPELLGALRFERVKDSAQSQVSLSLKNFVAKLNGCAAQLQDVAFRLDELKPAVKAGVLRIDLEATEAELRRLRLAENTTDAAIQELNARVSAEDRRLDELRTAIEEDSRATGRTRAVLAEIKVLIDSDACPVCGRPMPEAELRRRIEQEIGSLGSELSRSIAYREELESQVQASRVRRGELEDELTQMGSRISELSRLREEQGRVRSSFDRLRQHELSTRWGFEKLTFDAFEKSVNRGLAQIKVLQKRASGVLSQFEQFESIGLLSKKRKELTTTRSLENLNSVHRDAALRACWMLGNLKRSVADARSNLVLDVLHSYKPLIQSLYSRFHVHPVFSQIDFEIVKAFKDWELYFRVSERGGSSSAYPATVFSTSQLNALAVSIFLALNLKTPRPFNLVFLDDPVQAMDDINVLGLCEVLRQLKSRRQMFISTHSPELYSLFRSKLRPSEGENPLRAFWFSSWSNEGPVIRKDEDEYLRSNFDLQFVEKVAGPVRKAS
jgi:DNA repair exonuclease SbcCD ATPase subunit